MRISDWSSDVCSSDLGGDRHRSAPDHRGRRLVVGRGRAGGLRPHRGQHRAPGLRGRRAPQTEPAMSIRFGVSPDRKSVVEGKSVYVRVNIGGRRILKKKTLDNKCIIV